MIYLKLFLTFLEIGAVSFGGGYGMISLIREKVLAAGWLTEDALLNIIAVAESTPGPIAVNMATFVGSSQGGLFGSFCATLGVVLPAFIIILIIAALLGNFLKYRPVSAFLTGVRPVVVGLILATGLVMFLSQCLGITTFVTAPVIALPELIIFAILLLIAGLCRLTKRKKPSPILMILIAAALGIGSGFLFPA